MSWFDVIKEDDERERLTAVVQESALKIIRMIDEGRDKLYQKAEPMVQDLIELGLDEKIARKMIKGILAPMLQDLDKREADIKRELEELGDETKL